MKSLVFDAGPLISLTSNNLLWTLEPLSKIYNGDFILPESVKSELIDEPLLTKKFRFEALQVEEYVKKGVLKTYEDYRTKTKTLELLKIANSIFSARGKALALVHYGEIAATVTATQLHSAALVMDERVTRELIEHPMHLARIVERKIHTKVYVDKKNLAQFRLLTKNINIIRSSELAAIAFEKGLLERYVAPNSDRKTVLESVLWGLKIDGCAINERGIKAIMSAETKSL